MSKKQSAENKNETNKHQRPRAREVQHGKALKETPAQSAGQAADFPDHSTARTVRQKFVLQMQRKRGNRLTRRMLDGTSKTRAVQQQVDRPFAGSPPGILFQHNDDGEVEGAEGSSLTPELRQVFWDATQAYQRGDYTAALEGYQRLLNEGNLPEGVRSDIQHNTVAAARALFHQAREALSAGEVDRAFDGVERSMQIEGLSEQDQQTMQENLRQMAGEVFQHARQMAQEGNVEQAFDSLERAARLPGMSTEDREIMVENARDLGQRVFERAQEQLREGNVEEAFDNLERATRVPGMSPEDQETMRENITQVGGQVMQRAQEQFRQGDYRAALENLDRAMRVPGMSDSDLGLMRENERQTIRALLQQAVELRRQGRNAEALEIMQLLEQREGLSPDVDADLDYNIGLLLHDLGRSDEAISYLEGALSQASDPEARATVEQLLQNAREAAGQGGETASSGSEAGIGQALPGTVSGVAGSEPAGAAAAGSTLGQSAAQGFGEGGQQEAAGGRGSTTQPVPGTAYGTDGDQMTGRGREQDLWQQAMEHYQRGNYLDAIQLFRMVYTRSPVPDFRNSLTLEAVRYIGLCQLELGNFSMARRYLNQYTENGGDRSSVSDALERAQRGQEGEQTW